MRLTDAKDERRKPSIANPSCRPVPVNRDERGKPSMTHPQPLDARRLRREIRYPCPDGKPYRRRARHALLHVPNHQTCAPRPPIAALHTCAGVVRPPTELVVFLKAD